MSLISGCSSLDQIGKKVRFDFDHFHQRHGSMPMPMIVFFLCLSFSLLWYLLPSFLFLFFRLLSPAFSSYFPLFYKSSSFHKLLCFELLVPLSISLSLTLSPSFYLFISISLSISIFLFLCISLIHQLVPTFSFLL